MMLTTLFKNTCYFGTRNSYLKEFVEYITMVKTCEFCDTSFSSKRCLTRHQQTSEYCINIQKEIGLNPIVELFSCICSKEFTLKYNLEQHKKTCKKLNTGNTKNKTSINTSSNNRFTISDLNRKYIIDTLEPLLTTNIIKSGIGSVIQIITEILLQRNGKYCYYCTDKSRKKFVMLVNIDGKTVEQKDPNAHCLRYILTIPLQLIVGNIAKNVQIKSIHTTYKHIEEMKTDGSVFTTKLATLLPSDPEGIPDCMKSRIEEEKDNELVDQVNSIHKEVTKARINTLLKESGMG